ncbi:MAG: hypothetical protein IKJ56_08100 [Bacteroidales bacterium]|nr:hypothetical protein [Bacteroidales bacterium]
MLRKIKAELANCQERLKALEIKRGEDLYEQTHKEQKAPENPMNKLIDEQLRMLQETKKLNDCRFGRNGAYARYADAISCLAPDLYEGIESGHFGVMDATLYSVNSITRSGVKMFEGNMKQLGVCSLDNGKSPHNSLMIVSDIRVLYGLGNRTGYGRIPKWMEDGELVFEQAVSSRVAMLSMSDFATDTQTVTLVNPQPLRTQESYRIVINWPEFPESENFEEGVIKVLLHGLMVYRK